MTAPKNQNTPKATLAASIGAAAGMLGCPVDALKQAKRDGCPAFKSNGSVDLSALKEWLAAKPPTEGLNKAALECRRLLAQCEKLEHQLAVERGQYTANDQIRRDLMRIGSATRAALQRLRADVPSLEGLPAADIDRALEQKIDEICADLNDATSALYQ